MPPMVCAEGGSFPAGYPAPHAPFPNVVYGGGSLITAPQVVTVTFPGDSLAPQLETFGDQITQTCYWDAVRAGYCGTGGSCIGRGTTPTSAHARLTTAPASSYTDTQGGGTATLQQFIQAQVASGALPAPNSNTIYAMYFPGSTSVSLDGQTTCQTVGGWHNHTTVTPPGGSATAAVYAVIAECASFPGFGSLLDETTFAASHEIIESATDPTTGGSPGYYIDRTNQDNVAWELFGGGEIGDLCVDTIGEVFRSPHDQISVMVPGGTFTAQRIWSNEAAALGGDPCVPVGSSDAPYFNVALSQGNGLIHLAVGGMTVIEADAFSTGPTNWQVTGLDYAELQGQTPVVKITPDNPNVSNGTKMMLTMTLVSQPPMLGGGFSGMPYLLVSQSGTTYHSWAGLVVTP
jgi:hypothetical protein